MNYHYFLNILACFNMLRSSNCLPIICNPKGKFFSPFKIGSEMQGTCARDQILLNSGLPVVLNPLSAIPQLLGVIIASNLSNILSKFFEYVLIASKAKA